MDPLSGEHVKGDPVFRRRLFTVYAISLALLILVPWKLGPPAWSAFIGSSPGNILRLGEAVSILFLLAFIAPSLYLIVQGRRILGEGRYPHSRMKVIFDTPLRRGPVAAAMGRRLRGLGFACIAAVLLGSAATHFIFHKFKTDPGFFLRR